MGANEAQRKENGHVQRDNNLEQGGEFYILWNDEKEKVDYYYVIVEWILIYL